MALPIPTTSESLRLDATAIARATTLVAASQDAYDRYVVLNPTQPSETIVVADVYTGAITIGLNYFAPLYLWQTPPAPTQPTVATFTAHSGTGTTTVAVNAWTSDVARATAIRTALGSVPTLLNILGCALATGLAMQSGIDVVTGPFT